METVFRAAEPEKTVAKPAELVELGDAGHADRAIPSIPDMNQTSPLEKWEIQHGKYGLEYLGIKEVGKEFPYNAQFSVVDKYIKEEIKSRGYDLTPEKWQEILAEIESEIGTGKLDALERLKKLRGYIDVVRKYRKAKELKERYIESPDPSVFS